MYVLLNSIPHNGNHLLDLELQEAGKQTEERLACR